MTDLIIQVGLPIVTALISYMAAMIQSKNQLLSVQEQNRTELEKVKEQSKNEIEKIKEQSKSEIEKIKVELDKQAEIYEKNAQIDLTKEFMGDFMKSPEIKEVFSQKAKQELSRKLR